MRARGPQLQGLGSLTALASIHAPWGDHVLAPVPLLQRKRLCTAFQQLISQQTETENIYTHSCSCARTHAHAYTRTRTHVHAYTRTRTHVLANTHTYTHTHVYKPLCFMLAKKNEWHKNLHTHTHKYTL